MRKLVIGTLVATLIYFFFQMIMWEGGFHDDFRSYSSNQTPIMNSLIQNLSKDGLYVFPMVDPSSPNKKEEEKALWTNNTGKPWAMIFYHESMSGMEISYLLLGILYNLIACLIASLLLYYGNFSSFRSRFTVCMALSLFTLSQGVLDDMNWWSYPWSFVKPQVIDLVIGWGICSCWLSWYFKNE